MSQIVEKTLGKEAFAPQKFDIILAERQPLDIVDDLFQPCGNGKTAPSGTLRKKTSK
jgi:hypothetical protein